ncbi:hypothetical protein L914_14092 [Phytophthora nicotianae]|uniref:Uncharacterized protein n=2 Tax=Phytophthora nicotianae TaxID=4792 RepID=V9EMU7_PHYNI|nr:hypothetical protein F443_14641 [Phytophthora nicotianae P1569]ETM39805.1 hypothetical protein L914_14092 [Phytophthora nicotianae]
MTLLAGLCMSVRARAPSDVGFEPQVDRCSDWRCSTSSSAPPRLCPICGLMPGCRRRWLSAIVSEHASQRANRVVFCELDPGGAARQISAAMPQREHFARFRHNFPFTTRNMYVEVPVEGPTFASSV